MRESNKNGVVDLDLIPFRILVEHVFNAIKDQPWVRHLTRPLSQNLKGLGSRDYCTFLDGMGHPTIEYRSNDASKIWLIRDIFESTSSTLDNPRRLKYKGNTHHKTVRLIDPSSNTGR